MKNLCIVLVLILLTSLSGMAHAEVRLYTDPSGRVEYDHDNDGVVDEVRFFAFEEEDCSNASHVIEVNEDLFYRILADQEYHDGLWYVQTCKWVSQAACDVADFVVFWD